MKCPICDKEIISSWHNEIILTDSQGDSSINETGSRIAFYKYQSAANIISYLSDDIRNTNIISDEIDSSVSRRLVGVYSPVNNCLKTTYSLTYGTILAEKDNVLYINLEGYNGLARLLEYENEVTLMDLLYEYSLYPDNIQEYLPKYIKQLDQLNILLPVKSPFQLQEIDVSLWLSFLRSLVQTGLFETIILDMSDTVRNVLDILNVCSDIIMPYRKDMMSMAKLKDFDEECSRYPSGEELKKKVRKIRFPYFDDIGGSLFNLKNSQLGIHIRDIEVRK